MARGGDRLVSAVPVLLAIVITFVTSYFVLRAAGLVQRVLRQSGVAILERVMGLILAAIAVQFIADGCKDLLREKEPPPVSQMLEAAQTPSRFITAPLAGPPSDIRLGPARCAS
jgi:multiple antibiotic resistance protein